MSQGFSEFLEAIAERARGAGVFGPVSVDRGALICAAKNSAEPAEYRIFSDAGKTWIAFVTPNRWLSESIESDLEHTGDHIEELIDEELAELDYKGPPLGACQHFRDDQKLFTFRSVAPGADAATAATCLLAYEACFRRLGDVDAGAAGGEEA
jgi:hypothetical protein